MSLSLQPVILSGGSGTRLWPLSRETYPKQLLALTSELSMLQQTAKRLDGFAGGLPVADAPVVVCNEEYRFISAEQMRHSGYATCPLILEPFGRNTAPALAMAAHAMLRRGEDAVLLVMPADHVIMDLPAFHQSVDIAAQAAAAQDIVVTFGIVPEHAETGYGYIRAAAQTLAEQVQRVEAFVEKPDAQRAQAYVESGDYLWNSGLFVVRASIWLKALEICQPVMAKACERAFMSATQDSDFLRISAEAFAECPSDSIDYAVMEPLSTQLDAPIAAGVVPMSAGWSDVGAWDALWALSDKDDHGNSGRGDVLFESSSNTFVHASDRLVACVGVEDLIVVETPDAVMVASRQQTQKVKQIVARLKAEKRTQAGLHRKIYRPWGFYDSIDAGERFQVKRIVVNPAASLSLQMHHHRAEHWIVVSGTARVTRGEESFLLSENQSTYIPLGTTHRLENPGKVPLEMIEVQSGSYLGEDDIVRFEDTYGRS